MRQRLSQIFYEDRVEPVTPAELAASHSHGEHDAIEAAAEHAPAELTGAVGGGQHLVDPQDETAPDGRNR